MEEIGYAFSLVVTIAPVALTLTVGIVLLAIRKDRLTSRARVLGIAGCIAVFLNMLMAVAYGLLLPRLWASHVFESAASIGTVSTLYGLGSALVECVGLGLLMAAILAAAPAPPAPPAPPLTAGPPPAFPAAAS
jgi:hypothetical protein